MSITWPPFLPPTFMLSSSACFIHVLSFLQPSCCLPQPALSMSFPSSNLHAVFLSLLHPCPFLPPTFMLSSSACFVHVLSFLQPSCCLPQPALSMSFPSSNLHAVFLSLLCPCPFLPPTFMLSSSACLVHVLSFLQPSCCLPQPTLSMSFPSSNLHAVFLSLLCQCPFLPPTFMLSSSACFVHVLSFLQPSCCLSQCASSMSFPSSNLHAVFLSLFCPCHFLPPTFMLSSSACFVHILSFLQPSCCLPQPVSSMSFPSSNLHAVFLSLLCPCPFLPPTFMLSFSVCFIHVLSFLQPSCCLPQPALSMSFPSSNLHAVFLSVLHPCPFLPPTFMLSSSACFVHVLSFLQPSCCLPQPALSISFPSSNLHAVFLSLFCPCPFLPPTFMLSSSACFVHVLSFLQPSCCLPQPALSMSFPSSNLHAVFLSLLCPYPFLPPTFMLSSSACFVHVLSFLQPSCCLPQPASSMSFPSSNLHAVFLSLPRPCPFLPPTFMLSSSACFVHVLSFLQPSCCLPQPASSMSFPSSNLHAVFLSLFRPCPFLPPTFMLSSSACFVHVLSFHQPSCCLPQPASSMSFPSSNLHAVFLSLLCPCPFLPPTFMLSSSACFVHVLSFLQPSCCLPQPALSISFPSSNLHAVFLSLLCPCPFLPPTFMLSSSACLVHVLSFLQPSCCLPQPASSMSFPSSNLHAVFLSLFCPCPFLPTTFMLSFSVCFIHVLSFLQPSCCLPQPALSMSFPSSNLHAVFLSVLHPCPFLPPTFMLSSSACLVHVLSFLQPSCCLPQPASSMSFPSSNLHAVFLSLPRPCPFLPPTFMLSFSACFIHVLSFLQPSCCLPQPVSSMSFPSSNLHAVFLSLFRPCPFLPPTFMLSSSACFVHVLSFLQPSCCLPQPTLSMSFPSSNLHAVFLSLLCPCPFLPPTFMLSSSACFVHVLSFLQPSCCLSQCASSMSFPSSNLHAVFLSLFCPCPFLPPTFMLSSSACFVHILSFLQPSCCLPQPVSSMSFPSSNLHAVFLSLLCPCPFLPPTFMLSFSVCFVHILSFLQPSCCLPQPALSMSFPSSNLHAVFLSVLRPYPFLPPTFMLSSSACFVHILSFLQPSCCLPQPVSSMSFPSSNLHAVFLSLFCPCPFLPPTFMLSSSACFVHVLSFLQPSCCLPQPALSISFPSSNLHAIFLSLLCPCPFLPPTFMLSSSACLVHVLSFLQPSCCLPQPASSMSFPSSNLHAVFLSLFRPCPFLPPTFMLSSSACLVHVLSFLQPSCCLPQPVSSMSFPSTNLHAVFLSLFRPCPFLPPTFMLSSSACLVHVLSFLQPSCCLPQPTLSMSFPSSNLHAVFLSLLCPCPFLPPTFMLSSSACFVHILSFLQPSCCLPQPALSMSFPSSNLHAVFLSLPRPCPFLPPTFMLSSSACLVHVLSFLQPSCCLPQPALSMSFPSSNLHAVFLSLLHPCPYLPPTFMLSSSACFVHVLSFLQPSCCLPQPASSMSFPSSNLHAVFLSLPRPCPFLPPTFMLSSSACLVHVLSFLQPSCCLSQPASSMSFPSSNLHAVFLSLFRPCPFLPPTFMLSSSACFVHVLSFLQPSCCLPQPASSMSFPSSNLHAVFLSLLCPCPFLPPTFMLSSSACLVHVLSFHQPSCCLPQPVSSMSFPSSNLHAVFLSLPRPCPFLPPTFMLSSSACFVHVLSFLQPSCCLPQPASSMSFPSSNLHAVFLSLLHPCPFLPPTFMLSSSACFVHVLSFLQPSCCLPQPALSISFPSSNLHAVFLSLLCPCPFLPPTFMLSFSACFIHVLSFLQPSCCLPQPVSSMSFPSSNLHAVFLSLFRPCPFLPPTFMLSSSACFVHVLSFLQPSCCLPQPALSMSFPSSNLHAVFLSLLCPCPFLPPTFMLSSSACFIHVLSFLQPSCCLPQPALSMSFPSSNLHAVFLSLLHPCPFLPPTFMLSSSACFIHVLSFLQPSCCLPQPVSSMSFPSSNLHAVFLSLLCPCPFLPPTFMLSSSACFVHVLSFHQPSCCLPQPTLSMSFPSSNLHAVFLSLLCPCPFLPPTFMLSSQPALSMSFPSYNLHAVFLSLLHPCPFLPPTFMLSSSACFVHVLSFLQPSCCLPQPASSMSFPSSNLHAVFLSLPRPCPFLPPTFMLSSSAFFVHAHSFHQPSCCLPQPTLSMSFPSSNLHAVFLSLLCPCPFLPPTFMLSSSACFIHVLSFLQPSCCLPQPTLSMSFPSSNLHAVFLSLLCPCPFLPPTFMLSSSACFVHVLSFLQPSCCLPQPASSMSFPSSNLHAVFLSLLCPCPFLPPTFMLSSSAYFVHVLSFLQPSCCLPQPALSMSFPSSNLHAVFLSLLCPCPFLPPTFMLSSSAYFVHVLSFLQPSCCLPQPALSMSFPSTNLHAVFLSLLHPCPFLPPTFMLSSSACFIHVLSFLQPSCCLPQPALSMSFPSSNLHAVFLSLLRPCPFLPPTFMLSSSACFVHVLSFLQPSCCLPQPALSMSFPSTNLHAVFLSLLCPCPFLPPTFMLSSSAYFVHVLSFHQPSCCLPQPASSMSFPSYNLHAVFLSLLCPCPFLPPTFMLSSSAYFVHVLSFLQPSCCLPQPALSMSFPSTNLHAVFLSLLHPCPFLPTTFMLSSSACFVHVLSFHQPSCCLPQPTLSMSFPSTNLHVVFLSLLCPCPFLPPTFMLSSSACFVHVLSFLQPSCCLPQPALSMSFPSTNLHAVFLSLLCPCPFLPPTFMLSSSAYFVHVLSFLQPSCCLPQPALSMSFPSTNLHAVFLSLPCPCPFLPPTFMLCSSAYFVHVLSFHQPSCCLPQPASSMSFPSSNLHAVFLSLLCPCPFLPPTFMLSSSAYFVHVLSFHQPSCCLPQPASSMSFPSSNLHAVFLSLLCPCPFLPPTFMLSSSAYFVHVLSFLQPSCCLPQPTLSMSFPSTNLHAVFLSLLHPCPFLPPTFMLSSSVCFVHVLSFHQPSCCLPQPTLSMSFPSSNLHAVFLSLLCPCPFLPPTFMLSSSACFVHVLSFLQPSCCLPQPALSMSFPSSNLHAVFLSLLCPCPFLPTTFMLSSSAYFVHVLSFHQPSCCLPQPALPMSFPSSNLHAVFLSLPCPCPFLPPTFMLSPSACFVHVLSFLQPSCCLPQPALSMSFPSYNLHAVFLSLLCPCPFLPPTFMLSSSAYFVHVLSFHQPSCCLPQPTLSMSFPSSNLHAVFLSLLCPCPFLPPTFMLSSSAYFVHVLSFLQPSCCLPQPTLSMSFPSTNLHAVFLSLLHPCPFLPPTFMLSSSAYFVHVLSFLQPSCCLPQPTLSMSFPSTNLHAVFLSLLHPCPFLPPTFMLSSSACFVHVLSFHQPSCCLPQPTLSMSFPSSNLHAVFLSLLCPCPFLPPTFMLSSSAYFVHVLSFLQPSCCLPQPALSMSFPSTNLHAVFLSLLHPSPFLPPTFMLSSSACFVHVLSFLQPSCCLPQPTLSMSFPSSNLHAVFLSLLCPCPFLPPTFMLSSSAYFVHVLSFHQPSCCLPQPASSMSFPSSNLHAVFLSLLCPCPFLPPTFMLSSSAYFVHVLSFLQPSCCLPQPTLSMSFPSTNLHAVFLSLLHPCPFLPPTFMLSSSACFVHVLSFHQPSCCLPQPALSMSFPSTNLHAVFLSLLCPCPFLPPTFVLSSSAYFVHVLSFHQPSCCLPQPTLSMSFPSSNLHAVFLSLFRPCPFLPPTFMLSSSACFVHVLSFHQPSCCLPQPASSMSFPSSNLHAVFLSLLCPCPFLPPTFMLSSSACFVHVLSFLQPSCCLPQPTLSMSFPSTNLHAVFLSLLCPCPFLPPTFMLSSSAFFVHVHSFHQPSCCLPQPTLSMSFPSSNLHAVFLSLLCPCPFLPPTFMLSSSACFIHVLSFLQPSCCLPQPTLSMSFPSSNLHAVFLSLLCPCPFLPPTFMLSSSACFIHVLSFLQPSCCLPQPALSMSFPSTNLHAVFLSLLCPCPFLPPTFMLSSSACFIQVLSFLQPSCCLPQPASSMSFPSSNLHAVFLSLLCPCPFLPPTFMLSSSACFVHVLSFLQPSCCLPQPTLSMSFPSTNLHAVFLSLLRPCPFLPPTFTIKIQCPSQDTSKLPPHHMTMPTQAAN